MWDRSLQLEAIFFSKNKALLNLFWPKFLLKNVFFNDYNVC